MLIFSRCLFLVELLDSSLLKLWSILEKNLKNFSLMPGLRERNKCFFFSGGLSIFYFASLFDSWALVSLFSLSIMKPIVVSRQPSCLSSTFPICPMLSLIGRMNGLIDFFLPPHPPIAWLQHQNIDWHPKLICIIRENSKQLQHVHMHKWGPRKSVDGNKGMIYECMKI